MVGMFGNQGFMTLTLGIIGSAFATFLLSLLLLPDTSSCTVPIAISAVDSGQRGGAQGQLVAAGAVLGSSPSLISFLCFQRTRKTEH